MLHSSSEDDDDGTFRPVSILQYENSLQQVIIFIHNLKDFVGSCRSALWSLSVGRIGLIGRGIEKLI